MEADAEIHSKALGRVPGVQLKGGVKDCMSKEGGYKLRPSQISQPWVVGLSSQTCVNSSH